MSRSRPGWYRIEELLIVLLIVTLLAWGYHAKLDQVVVALGEVIPSGQIKVIQHLEGGIIEEIHVKPGEQIEAGDRLITLNLASGGFNLEEIQAKLDSLQISNQRLVAEINGGAPDFSPTFKQQRADLVAAELQILQARRAELDSSLAVIESQEHLRMMEIDEANAKEQSLKRLLHNKMKELKILSNTFRQQMTSEINLLAAQSDLESLRGELEVTQKSVLTVQASLEEMEARRDELKAIFLRNAKEEQKDLQQQISQYREQLKRATEQKSRTVIRSPISGEVKNMRHHTLGGIVERAEPLMEIVPLEEELVVEARLSPKDRGYIEEGKSARIKIGAYDFIRYGTLQGVVQNIAADTEEMNDGTTYYLVTVKTDQHYLGDKQNPYLISPGMEATVDIHAGTQTVLQYLIRPVLKLSHDAFREP